MRSLIMCYLTISLTRAPTGAWAILVPTGRGGYPTPWRYRKHSKLETSHKRH